MDIGRYLMEIDECELITFASMVIRFTFNGEAVDLSQIEAEKMEYLRETVFQIPLLEGCDDDDEVIILNHNPFVSIFTAHALKNALCDIDPIASEDVDYI